MQGRCPGTAAGSCLGKLLGSGNRAGRGAERFWSQTHRDVKATAAEDEERPGKEPEAYAERPRRKHPCSQAVRRAQSWEGKAPFRRRPRLCRAKGEAPGAETGPWEHGQTALGWVGWQSCKQALVDERGHSC